MTRAAIYARFSSDLQSDRSIEDQVALCADYARRSGLTIVANFEDRARSGASLMGRDGLLGLMDRARAGEFDVVVVEALDRLSRDQEDLAGIYKRLSFADIKILAVHEGEANATQIGIRGLVGALFLQDLSHKVRRGLAGVTRDGRHAGGRAYGYRPVPGQPGELQIIETEAAVLRKIFSAFAEGMTPRSIAGMLNAEMIAPPRGAYWSASTLTGNKQRGYGLLVNSVYVGEIVWNRVRMIKDPSTGRRVSRPNPIDQWQRAAAPQLAIIDRELFDLVQQRIADRSAVHPAHRRVPRHLLSGLLRCGCCGAGMSVKDTQCGRVRIHCTAAKESGSCSNRKAFYLDRIEERVLTGLRSLLADRRAVTAYLARYNERRRDLAKGAADRKDGSETRLRQLVSEIDRTIGMTVKGLISEDEAGKILPPLRAERSAIEAELSSLGQETNLIRLHPKAGDAYLASIDRLQATLADGDHDLAKVEVRKLIDRITVTPEEGPPTIRLDGWLSSLTSATYQSSPQGGRVVAGERYLASPLDVSLTFSIAV